MPIARIKMPDGRIARFNVPEGTTEDQAIEFASQNLGDKVQSNELIASDGDDAVAMQETSVSPALGTLRNVAQGATFGFADEIEAAGAGLGGGIAALTQGENPMEQARESYAQHLPQVRQETSKYREQNPVSSLAGELVGGAGTGLAKAGAAGIGKAKSIGQALSSGAVTGAATGAAYGAGTAEGGLGERAQGAAEGAALGGLTGGALSGAGKTTGVAMRS